MSDPNTSQPPTEIKPPDGTVACNFEGIFDRDPQMRPFQYNQNDFSKLEADGQSSNYWTDLVDAEKYGPFRQVSCLLLDDGTFLWGEDVPTHAALHFVSGNRSPISAYVRMTPRERGDGQQLYRQVITIDPDRRNDERAALDVQRVAAFIDHNVTIRDDRLELVILGPQDLEGGQMLPPELFRGTLDQYHAQFGGH